MHDFFAKRWIFTPQLEPLPPRMESASENPMEGLFGSLDHHKPMSTTLLEHYHTNLKILPASILHKVASDQEKFTVVNTTHSSIV